MTFYTHQGPRRRAWERLKREYDSLSATIAQFNTDLASLKQNNPNCADFPIEAQKPLDPLPPMPAWEE